METIFYLQIERLNIIHRSYVLFELIYETPMKPQHFWGVEIDKLIRNLY